MRCKLLFGTGFALLMFCSGVMAAGEYTGERNAFNRFHGQGTYKYTNNNVYTGEWVDGRKSGKGTQVWSSGEKYEGSWSNNRENGVGTKTWANGDTYTGEWVQGKMSGRGEFKSAKGATYQGGFIAGQRNGAGVFLSTNGIKYEGSWNNNNREGEFTVKAKDLTAKGFWKGDNPPATATVLMANGEKYSGTVKSGYLPNGKGICTKKGSASAPCEFSSGKRRVVAVAPKPKPKPKPAPVAVKPVSKPKPSVAKPFKPEVAATAVATTAAVATVAAKPKTPKNPRTMKGVRSDGSQFYFKHTWGGESKKLKSLKVEKDINEFGAMRITANGGEFEVIITVDEYVGEAQYALKYFKASIQKTGESTVYRTSAAEPGKLTVLQDGKGKLIGLFSFTGYPYGNVGGEKRSVTGGEFAIPLK